MQLIDMLARRLRQLPDAMLETTATRIKPRRIAAQSRPTNRHLNF